MESKGISHTQLTALLWAGSLAPAAELLPALALPWAGRGSWLAPLMAIPPVLLSGWLVGKLAGDRGLAPGIRQTMGPILGRGVLLLYIIWCVLLLALRLRLCAQRLQALGQRDGALWFFLLGTAGMILWMGLGQPAAFARAGQLFLIVLLAAGGGVLLLSAPDLEPERVLPLWKGELQGSLRAALPVTGALGWVFCGGFLMERKEANGPGRWYWPLWGAGGCVLLALAQVVVLGNLGIGLASELDAPFFALAKSIGVEGAFQRVESVIAAVWILADLTLGTLLLFVVRIAGEEIFINVKKNWLVGGGLLLALALAFFWFTGRSSAEWNRTWVPVGNLIFALVLPGIMAGWKILCEKWHRRGISCG